MAKNYTSKYYYISILYYSSLRVNRDLADSNNLKNDKGEDFDL